MGAFHWAALEAAISQAAESSKLRKATERNKQCGWIIPTQENTLLISLFLVILNRYTRATWIQSISSFDGKGKRLWVAFMLLHRLCHFRVKSLRI